MSLYNMLHGFNEHAEELLGILNLSSGDFGRFRDAYLNADGTEIIVFTRCGGGNREDYEWVFDDMESHPMYIRDEDDDYDSTYCSFYFKVPEDKLELTKSWATGEKPKTLEEKSEEFFEKLKNGTLEKEKQEQIDDLAKKVSDAVNDDNNDDVIITV